jgi:glycosyltransferase involved in cell wall biosynthesis
MTGPRVLLLCDRLDIAGGVERFVCTLANHLAGAGFEVAVGSVATRREQLRYSLRDEVAVLHGDVALPAGDGAWALLRRQWRTGRALAALQRRFQPQAVVLNGLTTACSLLLASRAFAARTVCCDHNHFGARSRLWQRLREKLYRRVAAVVSLTEADAARFATVNTNTVVIANASALAASQPALPAQPVVLAVARHVAQKGLDLLLAAWPAVLQAVPQAQLRIAGDGPLTALLQAQAQALGVTASVQWLPPTPQIEAQYRAAAVLVLPSRYEGMPLALLEAQALGVPAVAFDCPTGPREIVGDEGGIVVPAGDTAALAAALVALLQDPERRRRMAEAALRRSRERFSPALHFERWTALLRRVAQQA